MATNCGWLSCSLRSISACQFGTSRSGSSKMEPTLAVTSIVLTGIIADDDEVPMEEEDGSTGIPMPPPPPPPSSASVDIVEAKERLKREMKRAGKGEL